uniref:WecB/TagA/CpsF family glycosyltransferase n=1 Tax=Marinobacterium profundum TaxID=1714300 RepID=UPI0009E9C657|nr:WecB/TagA/CpsF family glycosyltransferase [Marinobacterium profundum]
MKSLVIKMRVDVLQLNDAIFKIKSMCCQPHGSYVCVSNVHMCMEVFDSPSFSGIVNGADLVVADGKPICFAQKVLGFKDAGQVRGQDLVNLLCAEAGLNGYKVGLYGGATEETLRLVEKNIRQDYPGIDIVYRYSPPFRPLTEEENSSVIDNIINSKVDILLVGIGCPKQEIWMQANYKKTDCVMLGVGAAFDFIAGTKKHAPMWMQRIYLEWVFRLFCEPKRLWKRYLKHNPRFIYHLIKQIVSAKLR